MILLIVAVIHATIHLPIVPLALTILILFYQITQITHVLKLVPLVSSVTTKSVHLVILNANLVKIYKLIAHLVEIIFLYQIINVLQVALIIPTMIITFVSLV